MREKPIPFSAPMVRAVLAGTKTQTRRVVKPRKDRDLGCELAACELAGEVNGGEYRNASYAPGDRLWVREAWGYRCSASTSTAFQYMHTIAYRADDARHTYGPMPMDGVGLPKWRERDEGMPWEAWNARMTAYWQQWRPSMFMPRWASRITLEVTGVRVERLQAISVSDAIAEGVNVHVDHHGKPRDSIYSPVQAYRDLWEQINGPGSWGANPWVWVVEFRRLPTNQRESA